MLVQLNIAVPEELKKKLEEIAEKEDRKLRVVGTRLLEKAVKDYEAA
jgi:predicted transcriptional regulator